ncbi:hypothetical protein PV646_28440 [Streptomyces sp. ID05-26A]|nr:hypothetical protein [Streptomyces sp. ID05-26A]
MTEQTRWGKAGVRLSTQEADRRRTEILAQKHRAAASHERDVSKAHSNWAAGLVVPWRITQALNAADLYGPEVDLACGAREPDVDQWEAGELYPTWEQLQLLAKLTGCTARFFTFQDAAPIPIEMTSLWFHMPIKDRVKDEPVLEFPEHVWRPVVEQARS